MAEVPALNSKPSYTTTKHPWSYAKEERDYKETLRKKAEQIYWQALIDWRKLSNQGKEAKNKEKVDIAKSQLDALNLRDDSVSFVYTRGHRIHLHLWYRPGKFKFSIGNKEKCGSLAPTSLEEQIKWLLGVALERSPEQHPVYNLYIDAHDYGEVLRAFVKVKDAAPGTVGIVKQQEYDQSDKIRVTHNIWQLDDKDLEVLRFNVDLEPSEVLYYTDGSYYVSGNVGGYAWVKSDGIFQAHGAKKAKGVIQMEARAVESALNYHLASGDKRTPILAIDNDTVVNAFQGKGKVHGRLKGLIAKTGARCVWVKGHKDIWHNKADAYSRVASTRTQASGEEVYFDEKSAKPPKAASKKKVKTAAKKATISKTSPK